MQFCEFDKLLHNKAGNYFTFIAIIASLLLGANIHLSALIGWLVASIFGVLKDYVFDVYVQHEKADIYDVIVTSLGGLETAILIVLIGLLIS